MKYTTDDKGILNGSFAEEFFPRKYFHNFAAEPAVYFAQYPSENEKRRYAIQGVVAAMFVTVVLITAFAVS